MRFPRIPEGVPRPTPDGFLFIACLPAALSIAYRAESNALFLLVGLLVAVVAVGGIGSLFTLHGIHVRRELPPRAEAGAPFPVGTVLESRLPARNVRIEDGLTRTQRRVPRIPPGGSASLRLEGRISRRGRRALPSVILSSRQPFGFFERRRTVRPGGEILVTPRLGILSDRVMDLLPTGVRSLRRASSGEESDFAALRGYVWGDPTSRVHWRASAARGTLLVKTYDREVADRVWLVLDPHLADPSTRRGRIPAFERAVSLAATAADLFRARRIPCGLWIPGSGGASIPPCESNGTAEGIQEVLATVRHDLGTGPLPLPEERLPGEPVLVVTARQTPPPLPSDPDVHLLAVGGKRAAGLFRYR